MEIKRFAQKTKLVSNLDEQDSDVAPPSTNGGQSWISTSAEFSVRLLANSQVRFICFAVVTIAAVNVISTTLAERSANENLYRQYLDQARVGELGGDYAKASRFWRSAIEIATKLGDGDKAIADLYLRLAPIDALANESSKKVSQEDLRQAIAHYERVPNTTFQQIRTKEELLRYLSIATEPELWGKAINSAAAANLEKRSISLLNQGKIAVAIESFRKFVDATEGSDDFGLYEHPPSPIPNALKKLNAAIKLNSPLADLALPLMHDRAYYERDKRRSKFSMLEDAIAKSGRDPNDRATRKILGDQTLERGEFRSAIIEYQRCLGMKDDPTIRLRLQRCYIELQPKPGSDAAETLSTLSDLKKLQSDAFGANSKHVTKILERFAIAYRALGDFEKAEQLRKEILTRELADPNMEERLNNDPMLNGKSPIITAYENLLDVYLQEGKFREARTLFNQGIRQFNPDENIQAYGLVDQYELICMRAGWFKEASKLPNRL
jgi:tetratricopeptide (TPR) repeat protein